MKKLLLLLLIPLIALADTPPPNTVKAKLYSGDGLTAVTTTGSSINVNVTGSAVGGGTVDQGTGGLSPWLFYATSLPLPTGASSSALQSVANGYLASLDAKLSTPMPVTGTFFQATQPVSGTFFQTTQPISGSVSVSNFPATQPVSGSVSVSNFPATQPVSGTVTANQGTSPWVSSISNFPATQAVTQSTSPWVVSGTVSTSGTTAVTQSTSPWVVSGTVTSNIGTTNGLALDSTLSSLSAKFNSLGQKTMANSAPVVLSSDQSAIPVTGTFFQATQPVSGSLGRTWTLSSGSDSVNVGNFPATQAVTQSTSPWVVSGTVSSTQGTSPWVTSASQSGTWTVQPGNTANTTPWLTTINQGGNSAAVSASNALKVDGSAVTQPVSGTVTSNIGTTNGLALDATLQKLTISQGTALGSNTQAMVGGSVSATMPSYTAGQVSPISINLRGGTRVKTTGYDTAQLIRNNYATTNVTTAAYVQLVASTTVEINRLMIFDSSGQDLRLAVGAAAAEVDQIQIPPGGWDAAVDLYIPSGSRISVKAVSATASSGLLIITGIK